MAYWIDFEPQKACFVPLPIIGYASPAIAFVFAKMLDCKTRPRGILQAATKQLEAREKAVKEQSDANTARLAAAEMAAHDAAVLANQRQQIIDELEETGRETRKANTKLLDENSDLKGTLAVVTEQRNSHASEISRLKLENEALTRKAAESLAAERETSAAKASELKELLAQAQAREQHLERKLESVQADLLRAKDQIQKQTERVAEAETALGIERIQAGSRIGKLMADVEAAQAASNDLAQRNETLT